MCGILPFDMDEPIVVKPVKHHPPFEELDMVNVVRCKDCRYRHKPECTMTYTELDGFVSVVDDWSISEGFCHKGKKK